MYTLQGYHDEGKTQVKALVKGRRGNPLSVGIRLVGSFFVIFLDYNNKKHKPKKERKKKKMVLLR